MNCSEKRELLVLECYPDSDLPYDGLTTIFSRVKHIGRIVQDTKHLKNKVVLVCGIPHLYYHKISTNNTNIIYTTFESDRLPSNWVSFINRYNYCIVPDEKIKAVFLNCGVTIPIKVMHQGYNRLKRLNIDKHQDAEFIVGFLGAPVNRKNLLKLYAACKKLRETYIPTIKLHIQISFFYEWLSKERFEPIRHDTIVQWTEGKLDELDLSKWYSKLSCYVFPSSGEGWSYTPRESMYLGIPTIVSDIPLHEDLIATGYCIPIKSSSLEIAEFDGLISGYWNKIEVADIANAILQAYINYNFWVQQAEKGALWIANKWNNEDIESELIRFITEI